MFPPSHTHTLTMYTCTHSKLSTTHYVYMYPGTHMQIIHILTYSLLHIAHALLSVRCRLPILRCASTCNCITYTKSSAHTMSSKVVDRIFNKILALRPKRPTFSWTETPDCEHGIHRLSNCLSSPTITNHQLHGTN